jgi:hypothetical protein
MVPWFFCSHSHESLNSLPVPSRTLRPRPARVNEQWKPLVTGVTLGFGDYDNKD